MTATAAIPTSSENLFVSSRKEEADQKAFAEAQKDKRVSHDDFLQLLTAQLTHQDPLKPMEDTQFIGQMAQLQALDEQVEMTDAINAMSETTSSTSKALLAALTGLGAVNEELANGLADVIRNSSAGGQIQAASSMIGKHVIGKDTDGNDADGNVLKAIMKDGNSYLKLDSDQTVWLGAVTEVTG